jgi:alpha-acetolactate decarboxylase
MSAMELETAHRLHSTFTHVLMRDNAFDFALDHGDVTMCTASELHLSLPRSGPFLSADLSSADTSAQIKQIEDN